MKVEEYFFVHEDATLRQTIEQIGQGNIQIVFVIDANSSLVGAVSDGDIRRALLKGSDMSTPVTQIMNNTPKYVHRDYDKAHVLRIMNKEGIKQIPVVDDKKVVLKVLLFDEMMGIRHKTNPVILMAGGEGRRLSPLTDEIPKPLLKVGPKPILETIVDTFSRHGFENFYFTLKYKADMIKKHFNDGSRWDVNIKYIDEEKPLGTCGSLSLLPQRPQEPIIVMNGDILTTANFSELLDFHTEQKAVATMCVREFSIQVPYGVVRTENGVIVGVDEKPTHTALINAGIYVLSPEVFDFIPYQEYFDMPSLFTKLINNNKKTCSFTLKDYWMDIGRLEDFQKAQSEYYQFFRE